MYKRTAWYTEDRELCCFCYRDLREQEGNVPKEHRGKEENLEHKFSAENWRN